MTGQVVTQEHFEGLVQDLNDVRDEIDALRAEVAAMRGDDGGNVLARVACPADVGDKIKAIEVPGVVVEIPGPVVGYFRRPVGSDLWHFERIVGTPGPMEVLCAPPGDPTLSAAEYLVVRL